MATAAGRAGLAALAGTVAATAFPPAVAYPAGLVGLVVVMAMARRTPGWGRRALLGWWFGAGYFGVVLGWSDRFGAVAVISLVASQAVFHALALALTPPRRAAPGQWVAGAAAAWVLAEFARARVPLGGFEWAQLGQLVADLPVRAAAAVVGSLGVSGLVVALAAGLVVAAERWPLRTRLMPVGAAVVAAVGLAAVGTWSWTRPAGELSVALVQVDPVCPGRPMVACPHQPERLRQAFTAVTRDSDRCPRRCWPG